MAKRRKPAAEPEKKDPEYLWVRAIVDCGQLGWEYQVEGRPQGRQSHDEDVSEWSEDEIIDLTRRVLDVTGTVKVEVRYA